MVASGSIHTSFNAVFQRVIGMNNLIYKKSIMKISRSYTILSPFFFIFREQTILLQWPQRWCLILMSH